MKRSVLIVLLFIACLNVKGQNLPSPSANLQTLTAGSYVIALDNSLQVNSGGYFNVKAYGLIVHLLNNGIKLKWAIKAGKAKDGIDFTATAEQFQPTLVAGGISRNFKAGPFVINAADTTGVANLIRTFYTTNGLTGTNRPQVYRLTATVNNVDIRYDMAGFRPKVCILNDGRNTDIHIDYMTTCAIPAYNYSTGPGTDLIIKCYTFASEPHNGTSNNATISAIRTFVKNGGNFLAQCEAIETYENNVNGHFHTTNGIRVTNSSVSAAATVYPNPDLSFSQFEGVFNIKQGGSVNNWVLETGSSFTNNAHNHATGGTIVTQTPIGASVSKLTGGSVPGGMVFYLGNHSFTDMNKIEEINGIRMYMNAMLTPNSVNINCEPGALRDFPLPVKLISFDGNLHNKKSSLNWKVADNEIVDHFDLESSVDGFTFKSAAVIFGSTETGTTLYNYTETVNTDKIFYRLKMTDKSQVVTYSKILVFQNGMTENEIINIIGNPVTDKLTISFNANENKAMEIAIVDMSGRQLQIQKINSYKGNNLVSLSLPASIQKGMYMVILSDNQGKRSTKFIKH
jgi:hypothetical protein